MSLHHAHICRPLPHRAVVGAWWAGLASVLAAAGGQGGVPVAPHQRVAMHGGWWPRSALAPAEVENLPEAARRDDLVS